VGRAGRVLDDHHMVRVFVLGISGKGTNKKERNEKDLDNRTAHKSL
jgi:hypothetical protein